MSSLLLYLNSASCLTILKFTLLCLVCYAVIRLARSEASPRKRRHREKKKKPKAFGCCEEELEEACASLETWPSVSTSAMSQFSYSSMESTTSSLWSPSSFSLTKASVTGAEPLCHTRDSMPVASWEGSTHPIQAQPLPRPPAHSRRDRREQTIGLDQTSAQGSDFNIQQKYLQSQLGAPQTPIPGESLLSEWDTKQQLELDTDPPNVDFQQRSQSP
ncbi:uncharacterized protein LOC120378072 isoform X3 [Mauremys reevesii]|uniref:uncharacterized protein LOC120378072 isoform X3 n=1 Tax=Mauremys reevesii TaxID=260615 RepID=UPI00193FEE72|nr:uncharacterized protein LOC120378072 isoform X3 [Mauremys reevesii]